MDVERIWKIAGWTIVLALLLLFTVLVVGAVAQTPIDQMTPQDSTGRCCDESDGKRVPSRKEGSTWIVFIEGVPVPVPPLKIIANEWSPYPRGIVWGFMGEDGKYVVRCWLRPGAGG